MIAIIGAGAIGRLWASSLSSDDCCFLDTRKSSTSPITYDVIDNTTTPPRTIKRKTLPLGDDTLHNAIEAVLICTKAYSALEAAKAADAVLPKTIPFFLFQNGLGSQVDISKAIDARSLYAASTTDGANLRDDGTLILAGHGITHVGPLVPGNQLNRELDKRALEKLQLSDRKIEPVVDIWRTLWRKLIINCAINPITAIENCRNGDFSKTPTFQAYWPELKSELCQLSSMSHSPLNEEVVEDLILSVARNTSNNISSMLQDVRANRKTEINEINGFAARALIDAGYSASANLYLKDKVHALGH